MKPGGGRGENKVAKKPEIRAEKGQTKRVNLGWHRDRKENPISAPSIHFCCTGGCWFTLALFVSSVLHIPWPPEYRGPPRPFHDIMVWGLREIQRFQREIHVQLTHSSHHYDCMDHHHNIMYHGMIKPCTLCWASH
jgi:hypothetical protein